MTDEDFKTKIKTFSNKELLEQMDFMADGYYSDLVEVCLEELRCRLEATKWHYPSKGEHPTEGEEVFVAWTSEGSYDVVKFRHCLWGMKLSPPYAWQNIIAPKEEAWMK